MGAPRYSETNGLPASGGTPRAVSEKEREAVAICRAKWVAAEREWEQGRKARTHVLREMLAGKMFDGFEGSRTKAATTTKEVVTQAKEVTETNLFLRAQLSLKAHAADSSWSVRYPTAGDLPDDFVDEIERFHERLCTVANVTMEFSDALDDGGTVGPLVIWLGCDRVVNRKKQAGAATPIDDLVLAAANGDPNIHPLPGMDYLALAKAARDFAANETQGIVRTIEQVENLKRLAQESDQAWADEMEKAPEGYTYGLLRSRRLVYGEDILWDSRVTTRWQDARWLGILKTFGLQEARDEESWKPSARKALQGVDPTQEKDGWPAIVDAGIGAEANAALNKIVRVVEFWDRDSGEVHYFAEKGGDYDGFLERDSRYPYFDAHGRSVLKDWFPIRAATPVVHNKRTPERTKGIPWLEPAKDHAIQYVLFDSALTRSRKKAARVVECPDDEEVIAGLENGDDLVILKRPVELDDSKKDLMTVHTFGQSPVDLEAGKQAALMGFARSVDMTVEEISGQSVEPTLGQAEMAAQGARASRGGLLRKLSTFAGDIVRDLGALAKLCMTDAQVAEIMGPDFTARHPAYQTGPDGLPIIGPTGQPVPMTDAKGQPVLLPSIWDLFKGSSVLGDELDVVFGTDAQGMDLMRVKSIDDFIALASGPPGMHPGTTFPRLDTWPLLERAAKIRGLGRLKELDLPVMRPPAPGGGGGPPGRGEREAPGGGREDGRAARGQRGPPAVPGRQGRGERPGDVGDQSVRAHRVGVS